MQNTRYHSFNDGHDWLMSGKFYRTLNIQNIVKSKSLALHLVYAPLRLQPNRPRRSDDHVRLLSYNT